MGHIKLVGVGSFNGLADQPIEVLKVRRDGTIGANDRSDFLYKRAGNHAFLDKLASLNLRPDQIPIHVIALGAYEGFGCNRNGDAFTEEECRKNHERFVKHAKYYKNHQNKDPRKSYGSVELSCYNEPMRRVELLIFGNEKQSAADRTGTLVMPQATVDKLYAGKLLGWSMACKVAWDQCSNCGNKAPSRYQYCTEDTCINPDTGRRMPGCRYGLTKLGEDGFQQFVFNPDSHWFDISEVGRQADRIALGGLADYMRTKAAEAGTVIGGSELAEMAGLYEAAPGLIETSYHNYLPLVLKLAALEENLDKLSDKHRTAAQLGRPRFDKLQLPRDLFKEGNFKFAAQEGIVLGPAEFFRLSCPDLSSEKLADVVESTRDAMGSCFRLLERDPQLFLTLEKSPWWVHKDSLKQASESVKTWTWRARQHSSVSEQWAVSRIQTKLASENSARAEFPPVSSLVKAAMQDESVIRLARWHALYQLGALACQEGAADNTPLLLRVLAGNRV